MGKYTWRETFPAGDVDADVVGEIVEKIEAARGVVRPEDLIEAAQSKRSPLHQLFTWNDAEAAVEHRKSEARRIIGSLIVRVELSGGRAESTRGFQVAKPADKRGYVSIDRIQGDADMRGQLIAQARRELESTLKRFQNISALGAFTPRLKELIDLMKDDADLIAATAARRRPAQPFPHLDGSSRELGGA